MKGEKVLINGALPLDFTQKRALCGTFTVGKMRRKEKGPSGEPFKQTKSKKVSSKVPFQWIEQDKVSPRMPFQHIKQTVVPSKLPFMRTKCINTPCPLHRMSPLLSPIFSVVTWWHAVMITWILWPVSHILPLPHSSWRRCSQVTHLSDRLSLTDLGAFSQRERDAEASQAAVRVDHHVGDRIVGIGVLQGGQVTRGQRGHRGPQVGYRWVTARVCGGAGSPTMASEPCCSTEVGNLTSLTVKLVILRDILTCSPPQFSATSGCLQQFSWDVTCGRPHPPLTIGLIA